MATDKPRRRPRTAAECLEAGRRHARERGDHLTPADAARAAVLIRPHWPAILARREAEHDTA
jgi:hypothetical protein